MIYSPRAQPEVNKSHIPSLPKNNAGHHVISGQKRGIQHRVMSSVCHLILVTLWCERTDGQPRDYYVTTKISWLDRFLLGNSAPPARCAHGLRYNA